MPRVYEKLGSANKKLLMGPWMHSLPDLSPHEPLDYLPEMVRFFDRWVKGEQNGLENEPAVTYFVQGSANKWKSERKWPVSRTTFSNFYLGAKRTLATDAAGEDGGGPYEARPPAGTLAGAWAPAPLRVRQPLDPRA